MKETMTQFAVITEVPTDYTGNYAYSEILINPKADKHCVGANILVHPPKYDEKLFVKCLMDGGKDIIDLSKKQILMCQTPVFTLGEIMIIDSNDRSIPDGRKPSKWDVGCEYFNDVESAIKRARQVTGDTK